VNLKKQTSDNNNDIKRKYAEGEGQYYNGNGIQPMTNNYMKGDTHSG